MQQQANSPNLPTNPSRSEVVDASNGSAQAQNGDGVKGLRVPRFASKKIRQQEEARQRKLLQETKQKLDEQMKPKHQIPKQVSVRRPLTYENKEQDFDQKPLNNQEYLKHLRQQQKRSKQQEQQANELLKTMAFQSTPNEQIKQQTIWPQRGQNPKPMPKEQKSFIEDRFKLQNPFRHVKQFEDPIKEQESIYNPFAKDYFNTSELESSDRPKYLKPTQIKKVIGSPFSSLLRQIEQRQQRRMVNYVQEKQQ